MAWWVIAALRMCSASTEPTRADDQKPQEMAPRVDEGMQPLLRWALGADQFETVSDVQTEFSSDGLYESAEYPIHSTYLCNVKAVRDHLQGAFCICVFFGQGCCLQLMRHPMKHRIP